MKIEKVNNEKETLSDRKETPYILVLIKKYEK